MPKGSEELTDHRKNEIVEACARLYETKGFKEITIKDISTETSLSRPSIYNYFETKEEIFLALLAREYEEWGKALRRIMKAGKNSGADDLAKKLARTIEKRKILLKISAMNLYEIEESSRPERLIEYKISFKSSMDAFEGCLRKYMPEASDKKTAQIIYAFFPFMYGIYPYAYPTEKQCEAMNAAKIKYKVQSVYELTYRFLLQILK